MTTVPLGHHITLDLFECECDIEVLRDVARGEALMHQCAKGLTQLSMQSHQFLPYSYSINVLLAESHISIHTWEQHRFASLDFYTCSGRMPEDSARVAVALLKPKKAVKVEIIRGTTRPVVRTETDYRV